MATRRNTAEITLGAGGVGSDDLSIYPTTNNRFNGVRAIVVRTDAPGRLSVDVREIDIDDDDEETDGDLLFHVYQPRDGHAYYPQTGTVDEAGAALATSGQPVRISTRKLRVDVSGGAVDDVVYVDVFTESPGDQRF
jgi:hypothetical protein